MDVCGVHQQLIEDYRSFTTGVVDVGDPRIRQHVAEKLTRGEQWPEPWLSRWAHHCLGIDTSA